MISSWSSPYFKCAWIAAVSAIILVDVAPGAIHIETSLTVLPKSFLVPSLPPNSVYHDYSSPFDTTGDEVHPSSGIAPVYLAAYLYAGTYVDATPPSCNMLVLSQISLLMKGITTRRMCECISARNGQTKLTIIVG